MARAASSEHLEERTAELEKTKEDLEKSNRIKDEFLANISHELRTPVHAILSFSGLGSKLNNSSDEARQFFSIINESGKRLLNILDNLLDLSKLESQKFVLDFKKANIARVIGNVLIELQILINEKNLTVEVAEPEKRVTAKFDENFIMQVVRNLVANAVKFTPEGKQILISFDKTSLNDKDGRKLPALCVSVIDQGFGIPDAELESIFDKFSQSSKTKSTAGGTGLGLAICKEIVEGHGGKIWAEQNEYDGATFHFVIPTRV